MAAEQVDLGYDPASYAGPFSAKEARAFERWLRECQSDRIRFDPLYLDHLRAHHGGVPAKRYLQTERGTAHVIERFLNFAPDDDTPWAQYRVANTWGMLDERLGTYLVPFAELFAGDMLCFDYERAGKPRVVAWFHERSEAGRPFVEPVADDFASFLARLTDAAAGEGRARATPTRQHAPRKQKRGRS